MRPLVLWNVGLGNLRVVDGKGVGLVRIAHIVVRRDEQAGVVGNNRRKLLCEGPQRAEPVVVSALHPQADGGTLQVWMVKQRVRHAQVAGFLVILGATLNMHHLTAHQAVLSQVRIHPVGHSCQSGFLTFVQTVHDW